MSQKFQLGPKQAYWLNDLAAKPANAVIERPQRMYLSEEGYDKICHMRFEQHMSFSAIVSEIRLVPAQYFEQSR